MGPFGGCRGLFSRNFSAAWTTLEPVRCTTPLPWQRGIEGHDMHDGPMQQDRAHFTSLDVHLGDSRKPAAAAV